MKIKRHLEIIDIIKTHDIETQDELIEKLKGKGFEITQSTISRDIKELKLNKVLTKNGKQKYEVSNVGINKPYEGPNSILSESIINIDYSQNIVVIKTLGGMAMAVAAILDTIDFEEILGTIAGDDTVFCVVKDTSKVNILLNNLKEF